MNRLLLIILFLFFTKIAFSQSEKDTVVYNMPVVDGKLTYADSVKVSGHSKAILDTALKKWFLGYIKHCRPDTTAKNRDPKSSLLEQVALEFRMTNTSVGLVKYNFYLFMSIKVITRDSFYSYKITDIFFAPQKSFYRTVLVYQNNPDYLISVYN